MNTQELTAKSTAAPDERVFYVQRSKRRPFWNSLLDVIVSGGVIGGIKDVGENANTPFDLVAGTDRGRIIQVAGDQVISSTAVPGWQPGWARTMKLLKVNDYEYRVTAQLA